MSWEGYVSKDSSLAMYKFLIKDLFSSLLVLKSCQNSYRNTISQSLFKCFATHMACPLLNHIKCFTAKQMDNKS